MLATVLNLAHRRETAIAYAILVAAAMALGIQPDSTVLHAAEIGIGVLLRSPLLPSRPAVTMNQTTTPNSAANTTVAIAPTPPAPPAGPPAAA